MLRILTSKSPLGRLFLVAASPYASKNGGLRINSTRPAHKNPITTRKWKTCSMSDSHSFLDLLRRKYACIVQENMKISTGSQKRSNDQSTSGELINYFLSTTYESSPSFFDIFTKIPEDIFGVTSEIYLQASKTCLCSE